MKEKKKNCSVVPTPYEIEQDFFYYNNEEDFREVLSEVLYDLGSDEEQRVSKFW